MYFQLCIYQFAYASLLPFFFCNPQAIPQISAYSYISTLMPLLFVLLLTAVKDGYDDYQRHQSDNVVNNRTVKKLVQNGSNFTWTTVHWMDVLVGDILRVENDENIPADMLVLSTNSEVGECFIETAELDGEDMLCALCIDIGAFFYLNTW